ncbi:uncharacterized protein N7496_010417 [Penicillium cataractarum]|uniref:Uncharacterized protein n=1 Tax=Penicillium cataractarum TaxID=2100454 RepID=A0A9W9V1X6_9EURO|nr:uncharacterized protein N7496_010417 [Penicillium cataractarum]KAJ5364704.1 hypothetical protein N7496_010417 [Penicillium cataractarum]
MLTLCPGVWGQTPLMDSVLCGSNAEISKFLEHLECLEGKNFLGQTAFHLAVLRSDVLSLLLETHSDFGGTGFNEPDIDGNSPLTYAAAYGCTESVRILLEAGANPLKGGHLDFIEWALNWNHWDVAAEALTLLRATARASDGFIQSELHHLMSARQGNPESSELGKMLNLGVDKNMLFEDGKTLLHHAPNSEWIDHLFDAGFQQIDHSDSNGETALMTFFPDWSGQIANILARGCNPNFSTKAQTLRFMTIAVALVLLMDALQFFSCFLDGDTTISAIYGYWNVS